MKTDTRITDITRHLAARDAAEAAKMAEARAHETVDKILAHGAENVPSLENAIATARAAMLAKADAEKKLARLPLTRRTQAAQAVKIAESIAADAARLGGDYSGTTRYSVKWGNKSGASTHVSQGDQYSRRCTYQKYNADHIVTLCPAGVSELIENESLRQLSARDGFHLIDLRTDGSAIWVRSVNKHIIADSGWVVGNGQVCYHSVKSAFDAQAGFTRKLAEYEKQKKIARLAGKTERRARLISRLCGSAVATIADAKKLGYCDPGIQSFQSQHGIGDACPLPQLVRTGNPSAVALALSIARKISVKKTLATV